MVRRPPHGQRSTSVPKVRWCNVAQSRRRFVFFFFPLSLGPFRHGLMIDRADKELIALGFSSAPLNRASPEGGRAPVTQLWLRTVENHRTSAFASSSSPHAALHIESHPMANVQATTSRTSLVPPDKRGVGVLNVNLFNTVKGLTAQAYIPLRSMTSPTAIRLSGAMGTVKAGKLSVSVDGQNVTVPVKAGPLNLAAIAGELARKIHQASGELLVEVKPGKKPTALGAATPMEVIIWKKGTTEPSPAFELFENGKRTRVNAPKLNGSESRMDITPPGLQDAFQTLITKGKTTYLQQGGFGRDSIYFKLEPKPG
jgi:hypothetical protein